jgi:phage terminase small subunit
MPRTKKPPGQAVDPRNGRQVELAMVDRVAAPSVPEGLRRESAVALWRSYWSDVVSGLVQPSEVALVERWVRNIDRYLVLMAVADEEPLVAGSMGQTRENPAYSLALKLEASIRADESQLGYGPKNRAALGIAVVESKRSLADLNAKYGGGDGGDDPGEEEDPRLTVVDSA